MTVPPFSEWSTEVIEPPLFGPPRPWHCLDGWTSHTWTVDIEGGRLSFWTNCSLCTWGVNEMEPEFFGGGFTARLIEHRDPGQPYYGIDPEVWWELQPHEPES